jgi:hypothetical protein
MSHSATLSGRVLAGRRTGVAETVDPIDVAHVGEDAPLVLDRDEPSSLVAYAGPAAGSSERMSRRACLVWSGVVVPTRRTTAGELVDRRPRIDRIVDRGTSKASTVTL